jgi:hypothetical protein
MIKLFSFLVLINYLTNTKMGVEDNIEKNTAKVAQTEIVIIHSLNETKDNEKTSGLIKIANLNIFSLVVNWLKNVETNRVNCEDEQGFTLVGISEKGKNKSST